MSLPLLLRILRSPAEASRLSIAEWELLLSQARRSGVMARLARLLLPDDDGRLVAGAPDPVPAPAVAPVDARVPEAVRPHLRSAAVVAERRSQWMRLECQRIEQALAAGGMRAVLLKGTGYLAAGLPPAAGRLFGDIDILVPKTQLAQAESLLLAGGWIAFEQDPYNQRYYREWMHEIPPLTHIRRGSVIDVHHTIVPPTSALAVDGSLLLDAARPASVGAPFWVLQPVDMVLHAAVHLYTEGEFERGLRDLLDLRDLFGCFPRTEPDFWPRLFDRAVELGLQPPLHHVLEQLEMLTGPLVPAASRAQMQRIAPAWPGRRLTAWLLTHALRPPHPSCDLPGAALARWMLYVRSHWLRMPLHLLVPHLMRKAWMRRFPETRNEPLGRG